MDCFFISCFDFCILLSFDAPLGGGFRNWRFCGVLWAYDGFEYLGTVHTTQGVNCYLLSFLPIRMLGLQISAAVLLSNVVRRFLKLGYLCLVSLFSQIDFLFNLS